MKPNEKPAVLNGKPVFKQLLPIVRPPVKRHIKSILADYKQIFQSGMITNSEYVKRLENAVAEYIGVKRCIATGSCTAALMLTIQALDIPKGEVLIPSFTFPATAHAAHWTSLNIGLLDCDPETFTIDTGDLESKITSKTKLIMPVHVFGNPCNIYKITKIAESNSLKVIYDSAHGFGAKYKDKNIGQFGDAEVFSGSPTKAFTTVEGGIVTTNNPEIAQKIEIGRNYGQPGNYNCEKPGLSARMSELHAAVGLNLLPKVNSDIKRRNQIATRYKRRLGRLPGIEFQKIPPESYSTYKDFAILINEEEFQLNRDELADALAKENIMTRKYFNPPLHMQRCYPELNTKASDFPNTTEISSKVLCLPMFSELTNAQVDGVTQAIIKIHSNAKQVKTELHLKDRSP
jgi:dTDP-4-amino-4,6-dideoxygalactose transaminase